MTPSAATTEHGRERSEPSESNELRDFWERNEHAKRSVQDRSEQAFREAYMSIREDGRQLEIARAKKSHEHEDDRDPDTQVVQLEENDPDEPDSTRGKITHFSRSSRRRLRRLFHSLRRDVSALLVTLTYHETDPTPREAKRHLDAWHKRFRRYCAKGKVIVPVIWRMEAQKRGTVHFHLMLFGTRYLSAEKASKWWHEVTDETSEQHRKSGVDVERVEEVEKTAAYCSKYLAKEDSEEAEWDDPGRFWGVYRKLALPVARWSRNVRLTDEEAAFLIDRLLNEWGVDLPKHASVPRLMVNTLGDPNDRLDRLLKMLLVLPSECPVTA